MTTVQTITEASSSRRPRSARSDARLRARLLQLEERMLRLERRVQAAIAGQQRTLDEHGQAIVEVGQIAQETRSIIGQAMLDELSAMACVVCGCTEQSPCEGGCTWVAPNLCSRCAAGEGLIVPQQRIVMP